MPNTPEGIIMLYAVNMVGAVANMVHPLSGEKELEYKEYPPLRTESLAPPAEDGNYYSLDHTMEYSVVVDDIVKGTFTFEDIYMDIDLEIENTTAVEELNANKTVSSVAYYNLAGQQSAQPVDGVNIVVTTYTDGSTTTAKVIK